MVLIGTIYSSLLLFSELSITDYDIISITFCSFIVGMGVLDISFTGYMVYSFYTFKPNAVFIGKAYVVMAFIINILSLLFISETNAEIFSTLKQLGGGVICFLFLCASRQVNNLVPPESRKILKRDKLWIGIYLAYPICLWY